MGLVSALILSVLFVTATLFVILAGILITEYKKGIWYFLVLVFLGGGLVLLRILLFIGFIGLKNFGLVWGIVFVGFLFVVLIKFYNNLDDGLLFVTGFLGVGALMLHMFEVVFSNLIFTLIYSLVLFLAFFAGFFLIIKFLIDNVGGEK